MNEVVENEVVKNEVVENEVVKNEVIENEVNDTDVGDAEVNTNKLNGNENDDDRLMEVKLGVVGGANAGKSSLIGVLSYNILDDGNGFARNKILKLPHERTSGATSSISNHHIKIPDQAGFFSLLDLAGHEKYLRTTLHGLSGYSLDYVIIIVGANMGVSRMTKEHLSIILPLRIPFIVVVTKIDIAPPDILKKTLEDTEYIIRKKRSPQRNTIMVETPADIEEALTYFHQKNYKYCPIFQVSNTTGKNLNLLKQFVFSLKSRHDKTIHYLPENQDKIVFKIYEKFNVKGVGLVISGCLKYGRIKVGTKLFLGPIQGDWKEITVKSIHGNF